MNQDTLEKIVALGTVTGLRSMSGLATLAAARGGTSMPLMALAAAGEMIADKTPFVGNRIDPLPLAGRAIMAGAVGVLIARDQDEDPLVSGLLCAATALVAAHLAYHARRRLPVSRVAGGLLEDSLVVALASRYA